MTFGWRHVWGVVAILIISGSALFAVSIWHTNSESRTRRLDRVKLPVLSVLASGHGGYTVLPDGCAVPAVDLVVDPEPVSPQVLSKLSGKLEWQPISEIMKPGDVAHYYTRATELNGHAVHYFNRSLTSPKGAPLFLDGSGGIVVMRGPCLVGVYLYWTVLTFSSAPSIGTQTPTP